MHATQILQHTCIDNSKNQIYLGGNFSALNIIPHSAIVRDDKEKAGSRGPRFKAAIDFSWVNESGLHGSPYAQLILYPQYPEVRLSSLLKNCRNGPSDVIKVRDPGRILFLGITPQNRIFGYATFSENPIAREFLSLSTLQEFGVFSEIPSVLTAPDTRAILLEQLTGIYRKQWILSKKIGKDGVPVPYKALNGGGYTLEAELGIAPNGSSEPDFLGWEIKQYGVRDFERFSSKSPITLMTPEPTGGIYCEAGPTEFVRRFGYADKRGRSDRMNFGGKYACGRDFHEETGLKLVVDGFDRDSGKITDMTGGIQLVSEKDDIACSWSFTGMMEHWNKKHAQAAYIPSIFRRPPPEYAFGPKILLCERTDFEYLLRALVCGTVFYDPGIKVEECSTSDPKPKRRNPFRISFSQLPNLYKSHEYIRLK